MRLDSGGLVRLDWEECWRFLERHALGRLAFDDFHGLMVLPINYVLDGGRIVFRTAPGTKLAAATSGQRAAFEVDEASELFNSGTSVVVQGTLRVVTDTDELERLRQLPLRVWAPGIRSVFVVVEPAKVSGRRLAIHEDGDALAADGG